MEKLEYYTTKFEQILSSKRHITEIEINEQAIKIANEAKLISLKAKRLAWIIPIIILIISIIVSYLIARYI